MRARAIWPAAGLLLLLAASCVSQPPAPQRPPKLEFAALTHAAGRVDAGRPLTHAFAFRNAGGLDLRIDTVRAACDCTAAAPSRRVVPPGETATIDVGFDTTHAAGPQRHSITVYSNDPLQPVSTLTLEAEVVAAVSADPAKLYVGHVRRGEQVASTVRLVLWEPAALGPVDVTGAVFDAALGGATAEPPQRMLQVTIKPDAPPGRFRELVRVRTDNPRRPVVTIPVVGFVDAAAGASEPRG